MVCGQKLDPHAAVGVPFLDSGEIINRCARAFTTVPQKVQDQLANKVSWTEEGHWLAAMAAFCQVAGGIAGGDHLLDQCREKKDEWVAMLTLYELLHTL